MTSDNGPLKLKFSQRTTTEETWGFNVYTSMAGYQAIGVYIARDPSTNSTIMSSFSETIRENGYFQLSFPSGLAIGTTVVVVYMTALAN